VLHALTVGLTGVGVGSVTADQGDIDCRKAAGTCSADIEEGTSVTLTATPDDGYVFLGWLSGPCSGGGTCTVTMSKAQSVKAAFALVTFVSTGKLDNSDEVTTGPVFNVFVAKTDGTGRTPLTGLASGNMFDGAAGPKWSPDGEQVVFQASGVDTIEDISTTNIWVAGGDGITLKSLTKSTFGGQNVTANWSPDGSRIVFCSDRKLDGTDAFNDNQILNIWLMNSDGSDPHPLTDMKSANAYNCFPQWSTDGSKIFFEARRDLDGTDHAALAHTTNIWSMNPDGSGLQPATNLTTDNIFQDITDVSHDGSRVIFRSERALDGSDQKNPNAGLNLWIVNADGSNLTRLTNLSYFDATASGGTFSHDESQIFFNSDGNLDGTDNPGPNLARNIWVMNADGSDPKPLTTLTAANIISFGNNLSADGSQILFSSTRDLSGDDVDGSVTSANIWKMNSDGTGQQPITEFTHASNSDGRWSY